MKEELIKKIEKFMCAGPLGPATNLVEELVDEIKFLEKRMSIDESELNSMTKDYNSLREFIMKLTKEADLDIERLREQIEVRGEHITLLKEKNQNLEKAFEQLSRDYISLSDLAADDAREAKRTIERLTKQVQEYAFDANNNFAINNLRAIEKNERLEKLLQEKDEYIKGLQYERDKVRSIIYACTSEINENVISKLEKAYDI